MIKIFQTGQAGSTKYLFDMHKVRTKIFRDRMKWDVHVNDMELEVDEYDLPNTVYILSLDENEKVTGTWRFLTTSEPSMIENIWPQYLDTLPIPKSGTMCETSRFGVYSENESICERKKTVNAVTAEMIVALIKVCIMCGITDMFTLYDIKIKKLLDKIGFTPIETSEIINLEGKATLTARFKMDQALLDAVQKHVNIDVLITPNVLPPVLLEKFLENQNEEKAVRYA